MNSKFVNNWKLAFDIHGYGTAQNSVCWLFANEHYRRVIDNQKLKDA